MKHTVKPSPDSLLDEHVVATTKQVRKLIRKHIPIESPEFWTDKRAGPTGLERTVKIYYPYVFRTSKQQFFDELNRLVGTRGWRMTPDRFGDVEHGLRIRCVKG